MTDEVLDLDAARAADADANRKPLVVRLGGQVFHVPRPLPLAVSFAAAEGDWRGMVTGLFGEQADAALAVGLTRDDVADVFERLMGGPGKSPTSAGSSAGGRKSKPTSKSTTASTRRKKPPAES